MPRAEENRVDQMTRPCIPLTHAKTHALMRLLNPSTRSIVDLVLKLQRIGFSFKGTQRRVSCMLGRSIDRVFRIWFWRI